MKIRKLFTFLLVTSLSFGMVACSEKIEGGNTDTGGTEGEGPSFGGGSTEGSGDAIEDGQTLLGLLNDIISKQGVNKPRTRVYIVAHRANTYAGMMAGCPDNSIPAINMAVAKGADMVELDVRTTSDNKLVLMHDATINASTNGSGNVADMTLEKLKSYSMERDGVVYKENGQAVKVPTLEEALLACKGKIFVNLDVKDVRSPAALRRIIVNTGTQGQVMVYNSSHVKEMTYAENNIAVHPHISSAAGVDAFAAYPNAKLFQYDYTYWYNGGSLAKDVRAKGYLTYSNILNYDSQINKGNYASLDKFIASETDFIQTDICEKVHDYLKKKGLR